MPKACRYCNEFFSLVSNCESHEQSCPMKYESLLQPSKREKVDEIVEQCFREAEKLSRLPKGTLSGNRESVRPAHYKPIPDNTPQSYSVEMKQVVWTACYQTSQGIQVCGGFDTVAFDVGKGFTKQSWLTLEASLRNQPGNSHLFNFRLMAAQILDY